MSSRTAPAAADGVGSANIAKNAEAEALYRKYGPMVTRRCRQLLGNSEEAADAAQEVFVKIAGNPGLPAVEFPSSFLWRVATNYCLNAVRNRKRRGEDADGGALLEKIAAYDDLEERAGYRGILRRLFRRHPESSRVIAILHFLDGMTLEETAAEVGMSVSGVRKRLMALREDLKINSEEII